MTNNDERLSGYEDLAGKWARINGELCYVISVLEDGDDFLVNVLDEQNNAVGLLASGIHSVSA